MKNHQSYSLSYYHHPSGHGDKVLSDIKNLRDADEYCDVTVVAGSKRILAHRLILAACCPYFKVMFKSNFPGTHDKEITITLLDPDCVQDIIDSFYTSSLKITADKVEDLLQAANFLQLEDLKASCCTYLAELIQPSNCLGIDDLATALSCKNLQARAQVYIFNYFPEVMKYEEFLMISAEKLIFIITSKRVCIKSEEALYNAVMNWFKYGPLERKKFLAQVLKHVRLPLLGLEFLSEKVECEPLIQEDAECLAMVLEAKIYLQGVGDKLKLSSFFCKALFTVGTRFGECAVVNSLDEWPLVWKKVPMMSKTNFGKPSQIAVLNGLVYVIGYNFKVRKMCTYDPKTNGWSPFFKAHTLYDNNTQVVALDGYLYAVGSEEEYDYTLSCGPCEVQRFDPQSKTWSLVCKTSYYCHNFRLVATNGLLYLIGGNYNHWLDDERTGPRLDARTLQSYNPVTDTWQVLASRRWCNTNPGAAVFNERIYVGDSDCVEIYDIASNTWSPCGATLSSGYKTSLVEFNSKLYSIGSCWSKNMDVLDERTRKWTRCVDLKLPFINQDPLVVVIDQPADYHKLADVATANKTTLRVNRSMLRVPPELHNVYCSVVFNSNSLREIARTTPKQVPPVVHK